MSLPRIRSKIETVNKLFSNHRIKNGYYTKKGGKRFIIVMYHGIDKTQNTDYNQRFFSRDNFDSQVSSFKKHCNVLTHDDFVNENFSSTKLNMVITFDDGYLNNYKYALPVLEKYDAHAYFFITGVGSLSPSILWADAIDIVSKRAKQKSKLTLSGIDFELDKAEFVNPDSNTNIKTFIKESSKPGYTEKQDIVNQLLALHDFTKTAGIEDYWQLMNDKEIQKTSRSKNITIGSHGFYHNNLGSLSDSDAVAEVLKSKAYLEGITQKEITTIGFPDGSYTPELNQSLFTHGFTRQFLVDYNFSDAGNKDYVYDRFGLYPYMGNSHQLLYQIIN